MKNAFLIGLGSVGNIFGDYFRDGYSGNRNRDTVAEAWRLVGRDLADTMRGHWRTLNMDSMPGANEMERWNPDGNVQAELLQVIKSNPAIPAHLIGQIAINISNRVSGPLPSPQTLAEYERILPGSAERLLSAFERRQKHSIEMDNLSFFQNGRGQIIGAIAVLGGLGVTALMGFFKLEAPATAIGTLTVVGLATIYYLGKKFELASKKQKEHR